MRSDVWCRRLRCGLGIVFLLLCAAALAPPGVRARVGSAVWSGAAGGSVSSAAAGLGAILLAIAWRRRDRRHVRRQKELRLAVRQRTEQLERGQAMEAARNRILEMLVWNAPLESVLEAIAKLACEQMPGAHGVVLLRQPPEPLEHGCGAVPETAEGCGAAKPGIGADPGFPAEWLNVIGQRRAVPYEVWRRPCDYTALDREPAWRIFASLLRGSGEGSRAAALPATSRSLPIGEAEAPLGAVVLFYPRPAPVSRWEDLLQPVARLAQIAIEHRRFYDELAFRANHDSLTGLPNRSLLEERLERAVFEAELGGARLALLYIDIDEFKQVNDRFGHRAGDALLNEIAVRIRLGLRPCDTVARVGGDEFNVILPDIGSAGGAEEAARRLVESVRQPLRIDGVDFTVTVSVGIAVFPDDGETAPDLQREADAAMYYAKSLGKNRTQTFSDNAAALDAVRLEQDLRRALEEDWFEVYYQPKFTAGGQLAGLEALIRMNHPSHGQILPGNFIPVAESSGLIVGIGAWVIGRVCRQIADWRRRQLAPVVVAVNVSTVQISRMDFAASVEACLASHAVPADCLEIEVTESMVINRDSEEHRQMQLLRGLGVCISIDDFGTGFSSLSYLNRLQVDAVKLDRSFAQSIDTDGGAQHVVRAMVRVAQELGLDVIAEGVETEAQRAHLVAAGCPILQGYLFARPGPPEAIEPLLCAPPPGDDLSRLYGALADGGTPVAWPV